MSNCIKDYLRSGLNSDSLFSGALALMSILIAVFTLSVERALYLKGEPGAYPWYFLCYVSGLSTVGSSVMAYCCYRRKWEFIAGALFIIILILCGLCIPLIGLVLLFSG